VDSWAIAVNDISGCVYTFSVPWPNNLFARPVPFPVQIFRAPE